MPKFTFMSWNVRMYKGSKPRLDDVDKLLTKYNPDVFGLLEFKAKKQLRDLMLKRFPEYDFATTDSTGSLEVVVGFKRNTFKQVIWTQRRVFNNKQRTLRPGALISVNFKGEWYNLLYLHTKSGTSKSAYSDRWKVFKKIWKLQKSLATISPHNKANLIVLGDLNTMGDKNSKKAGADEIKKLQDKAEQNGMFMLTKDDANTWHNWGNGPRHNRTKMKVSDLANKKRSDLDHVIASSNLDFVAHGDDDQSAIHVEGWQQLKGIKKVNFLWSLSDHSALFGEVW